MYTYEPRNDPKFPFKCNIGGHIFENETRAANFCKMWNAHWEAMKTIENIPSRLSRSEYESICAERGIEILSDADCNSYGVKNGEFVPALNGDEIAGYAPEYAVKMSLARRRMKTIQDEQKSQPKPEPKQIVYRDCDCGHTVEKSLAMIASLGTSCPDCYDRMSE